MADITGTTGADILIGTPGDDIIDALAGNDESYAGPGDIGNDIVSGGDGDDRLGAGAGDDIVLGDNHDGALDLGMIGDDGSNELFGGDGNDLLITGGYSNDGTDASLAGATGNAYDGLITGTGNSIAWAGTGNDIVYGAGGNDTLGGGDGNDEINGGGGDDVIYGGTDNGVDILRGGDGNDLIFNGGGNDIVFGGDGNDTMWGGADDDIITTGAGADVVGFISGNGHDTVTDFTLGEDILDLFATGLFANASEVIEAMTDTPNGVVLTIDANTSVTFEGLTVDDFRTTTDAWVNVSGTAEGSPAGGTFIYTAGADNFVGDVGDDTFIGGSIVAGGVHTVGAADQADGGLGDDRFEVILQNNTIIPNLTDIETVSAQALGGAPSLVNLVNAGDVETLVNDRSTALLNFTNVQAPVNVVVNEATGNTNVRFANNADNNGAATQSVEFNSTSSITTFDYLSGGAPTTLEAVFNNSNGAGVNFFGNVGDSVTTVDLELNGSPFNITGGPGGTLNGVNGTGGLASLMLSGSADVTSARANSNDIFNDVTNVDATGLTGTLMLDQLNADTGMTFLGGNAQTTVVASNALGANNDVTFGTDDNDRLVQSATNLNGFDSATDTGGSADIWEVHHTGGATIDYSGGPLLAAANNTSGFENLVVDVWDNTSENVLIDNGLLGGDFDAIIIQDTFSEAGGPLGAGDVDADVNNVTILGLDENRDVVVAANSFNDITLTAAPGSGPLQLHLLGSNDTASGDLPPGFGDDITGNNIDVTGADLDIFLNDDNADLGIVSLDPGGTVSLSGAITGNVNVEVDTDGATIDATGLTTGGGNFLGAANPGVDSINVLGTDQSDVIEGTNSDDILEGNGGDDILSGGNGNDILDGGDGNDVMNAGSGVTTAIGGEGNDGLFIDDSNFTSADVFDGGAGFDTMFVNQDAGAIDLRDGRFNGLNSVEELQFNGSGKVTLDGIANGASINTITNTGAFGYTDVAIGDGFSGPLTVNTDGAFDYVLAAGSPLSFGGTTGTNLAHSAELTVNTVTSSLPGSFFQGGTTANDVLNVTIDGGGGVFNFGTNGFETINILDDTAGVALSQTLTLNDALFTQTVAGGGTVPIVPVIDIQDSANDNITIDGTNLTGTNNVDIDLAGGNDVLLGSSQADDVSGGAGIDNLSGNGGDDNLSGGTGGDILNGGLGADNLDLGADSDADIAVYNDVLESSAANVDTISNFVSGTDTININENVMGGLAVSFAGNFNSYGAAVGGISAGSGTAQVVYDSSTNTLWVDVNDDGALNADDIQIVLDGVTGIAAGDVVSVANNVPIASDDFFAANEDDGSAFVGNARANDVDVETATAALVVTPDAASGSNGGEFSIDADGNVTFDTDGDFEALAAGETTATTFTYTVEDELGATDTATVTVTVTGENDAPVAVSEADAVNEDATTTGDVSLNDSDVDNGATRTYALNAAVAGLTLNANGTYAFDASDPAYQDLDAGDTTDVVATYTVTDDQGATDTATLTITVTGQNDAPVAQNDTNTVLEDGVTGGNVAANDSDVDANSTATYSLNAAVAGLTLNANGTYAFDASDPAYQSLAAGETTDVVATYTVTDDQGATDTATLTVTVTGVNDAPVAVADTDAVNEDATTTGDVSVNDSDVDNGSTATYSLNAAVAGLTLNGDGTYTFDASDAAYQSLAQGETTDVVATYTVTDDQGATDTATLTITVTGVDDPLTVGPVSAGAENEFVFTAEDVDNNISLVTPFNGSTAVDNGTPTTLTAIQQGVSQTTLIEVESDGQAGTEVVGNLIQGTSGADTVNPTLGTDPMLVATFDGNDTITTGDGDDFIFVGPGDNEVSTGSGADTVLFDSQSDISGQNTIDLGVDADADTLDYTALGFNDGSFNRDFTNIDSISNFDGAGDGDTIVFNAGNFSDPADPGIYEENLVPEASLSDLGDSAEIAFAGGAEYYFGVYNGNGYLVTDDIDDGWGKVFEFEGLTDFDSSYIAIA